MAVMLTERGDKLHSETPFFIFGEHFLYSDLCSYRSSMHLQQDFQRVSREIYANTNSSVLISYLEANSVASMV